MSNNWKSIWNKRDFDLDVLKTNDYLKIFKELKRASGFDMSGSSLSISSFLTQFEDIKKNFAECFKDNNFGNIKSIFEVGCGCGANLYLFQKEGLKVGGIDYSVILIDIAKKVLNSNDIICGEAMDIPVDSSKNYDVLLSNSVFSYFSNLAYANTVLEKMYSKCKYAIGLIDIHDLDKKEKFIVYRKLQISDYEEKYKNLDKLFYPKDFFIQFAQKHNMKIKFAKSEVPGYWNNDFVFNCFLYK